MQQTLEEVINPFHSLLVHDYNIDGISEIIATRLGKNDTEINIAHPKHMVNYSIKINERINTICMAQTSLERGFELVTGDIKGVVRINSRDGRPFFSKDIKDGIRLPSSVLCTAPGDLNGNKLSEIIVGCANGEVVMIERIPGKKHQWDKIRGFSLGKIFPQPATQILTGDFNGDGQIGFLVGSIDGTFKEIEFRPQLQKFDLIGEINIQATPTFCFNGDFDRDGISEVMIGDQSGKLSIYKRNRLMSSHNFDGTITCGSVGDVDNDRQLEIVVGTATGSFHILRQNTIESYDGYSNINDLRIGDLNGNRVNDLVFSIDKRRIVAFNFTRDKSKERPNVELIPYKGGITAATQQVDIPDTSDAFCPNCQSEVRFIEQYRRYYCYNCKQYIAPITKLEGSKQKSTIIETKSHGSPYAIGTPYEPYKRTDITEESINGIDKVKSKVQNTMGVGALSSDIVWQEEPNKEITEEAAPNYYLPLDLEADIDMGVEFFNDILKIRHVILIHSFSGVPLFSQGFGKEIDVSLTSGFLSAVGTFTEEMSGETDKRIGVFSEIGREGFWIIIYEGEIAKTALLVSEKIGTHLKKRISIFMNEFENTYKEELANFSGFISAFSETTDLLEKHLRLEYLYPLKMDIKRMRLTAISQNEKKIAKTFTEFLSGAEDEVYYVTELIETALRNQSVNLLKEDILAILIKYLENGMLIPIPPPPNTQL
ncbi:MAG: VCBS repeat-containing protein [Candidatus Heimdallarchaeota archaeon]|nr:VCBS repeat-containing protein [Candidatus Heimdallarchaeota archaeon]